MLCKRRKSGSAFGDAFGRSTAKIIQNPTAFVNPVNAFFAIRFLFCCECNLSAIYNFRWYYGCRFFCIFNRCLDLQNTAVAGESISFLV